MRVSYSAAPEAWVIPAEDRVSGFQWCDHTADLIEA